MVLSQLLKVSLILMLFLSPTIGFSQSLNDDVARHKKLNFGIKAGGSYTDLGTSKNNVRVSGHYKYHYGIFLETQLSKKFRFQPELVYSKQGGVGDTFSFNIFYNNTIAINYLNLPLMFEFFPLERFYLSFGPQIGFLLDSNVQRTGTIYDDIKGMDFSFGLGTGFDFKKWGIGLRFNKGLTDITPEPNISVNDRKVNNSVLQLSIYYSVL